MQTVGKDDHPDVRALLEKWYFLTGCPMLLNTSLNIGGKPIMSNKRDLLWFLNNSDIDYAVYGDEIIN